MPQLPSGTRIDLTQLQAISVQADTVDTCMGTDTTYMVILHMHDGTEHTLSTYPTREEAETAAQEIQQ